MVTTGGELNVVEAVRNSEVSARQNRLREAFSQKSMRLIRLSRDAAVKSDRRYFDVRVGKLGVANPTSVKELWEQATGSDYAGQDEGLDVVLEQLQQPVRVQDLAVGEFCDSLRNEGIQYLRAECVTHRGDEHIRFHLREKTGGEKRAEWRQRQWEGLEDRTKGIDLEVVAGRACAVVGKPVAAALNRLESLIPKQK